MKTKVISQQTALVTGGGIGIGRAFTEALLAGGIGAVIIASRRQNVLDEAAAELNSKFGENKVIPYAFDIRSRAETENLVRFALERLGAIDVLINNSGLAVPETVTEITGAGWDTVLETNLRGAMWLTQMLLPRMLEQDFGDIINVSSQAEKTVTPTCLLIARRNSVCSVSPNPCATTCENEALTFGFLISVPGWSMWKRRRMTRRAPDLSASATWQRL